MNFVSAAPRDPCQEPSGPHSGLNFFPGSMSLGPIFGISPPFHTLEVSSFGLPWTTFKLNVRRLGRGYRLVGTHAPTTLPTPGSLHLDKPEEGGPSGRIGGVPERVGPGRMVARVASVPTRYPLLRSDSSPPPLAQRSLHPPDLRSRTQVRTGCDGAGRAA